jgi:hypothetical protein
MGKLWLRTEEHLGGGHGGAALDGDHALLYFGATPCGAHEASQGRGRRGKRPSVLDLACLNPAPCLPGRACTQRRRDAVAAAAQRVACACN